MKKMIIFGAGKLGKTAIQYYKNSQDIAFVVDNKKEFWGSSLMGFDVCNPDVLENVDKNQFFVLLAVGRKAEPVIANQLKSYGFEHYVFFTISPVIKTCLPIENDIKGNKRIVSFMGGLGNQMFQYAFYKCLCKNRGEKAYVDLSPYLFDKRDFQLKKVFKNISFNELPFGALDKAYMESPLLFNELDDKCFIKADLSVLKKKNTYFYGYWQSNKYVEIVENELRNDFTFVDKDDSEFLSFANRVKNMEFAVSVHIRRSDYQNKVNFNKLGCICDLDYYKRAMEYMRNFLPNPHFLFFSDEPEWVKENFNISNSLVIEKNMFNDYEDWYDMYLMSLCKHNIIANSSFSWWGAWLNQNSDKIVIAPSLWFVDCKDKDVCPPEWIRL